MAAALAGSGLAGWLVLTSDFDETPARTAALILGVGWSFVAAGVVALARVSVRFGALMCAVGFAVYAAALSDADASIVFTLGLIVGSVWIAILVHALVAFPSGRLETRGARLTVAAAYAILTVGQLAVLLFDDLAGDCPRCPDNAVLIASDPTASSVLEAIVSAIGAAVALAVIVTLARHWRRASGALRRALAPVVWTGGAAVATVAALYASYVIAPGLTDAVSWVALALLTAFPFAFLAGLVRMRLARAAVGQLVIELGQAPPPDGTFREAVSRALHDPDATVAQWRSDTRAFVDAAGRPVTLEGAARASRVIKRDGEPVAALIHDAAQDPELVDAVAAAAGLALDNERLQAALRARLAELRASRARIVEAHATERRRLERNLHDGAQQRLVTLALELSLAESRIEADPAQARDLLNQARSELTLAIDELRELARGIHPALLTDRGLGSALEALAARTPMPVETAIELGDTRLPDAIEVAAYYVAAEALTNVVKYARAERAVVRAELRPHDVIVEVSDDGQGGADPAHGSGLLGLADRVEALDGRLDVISPPGGGTRIRATFPLSAGDRVPVSR